MFLCFSNQIHFSAVQRGRLGLIHDPILSGDYCKQGTTGILFAVRLKNLMNESSSVVHYGKGKLFQPSSMSWDLDVSLAQQQDSHRIQEQPQHSLLQECGVDQSASSEAVLAFIVFQSLLTGHRSERLFCSSCSHVVSQS